MFGREDIRFAENRLSVPGSRDLYTWGEAEGVNVDSGFLRVYDSFDRQNRGRRSVLN